MTTKPSTSDGYDRATTRYAEATCLYVATKLGDLMDRMVVVGGLVPSLLIRHDQNSYIADPHVGTMDVDLGLNVELLTTGLYQPLADRLRDAGFGPETNDRGNRIRQRWRPPSSHHGVGIDFLIQPTLREDQGGRLRNLQPDFAAIIAPGLHLAFRDYVTIRLTGTTIADEHATRDVTVCGPGAYIILKALAFRNRGENKDAYDLYYVLRHFGTGVNEIADRLQPLIDEKDTLLALDILREDFTSHDGLGPRRAAAFLNAGQPDDDTQADVVGFKNLLLDRLDLA